MIIKSISGIFSFMIFLIISICCSDIHSQHGVNKNWGSEYALPKFNASHSQRGTLFNNMAVASSGRIFVLTSEVNPLNGIISGIYLNYSDDKGQTWLNVPVRFTPVNLVIGGAPPRIEIDRNNILHILWSAKVPAALFYSRCDINLKLITDTVRVANKVNYSSFTYHLTVDKNNNLHAIWHEGDPGTNQTAEVYYSKSENSGSNWSSAIRLSSNDGRHSAFPRVQINHADGDTIAIAWRDSVSISMNWDVLMSYSTNSGNTWSIPLNIAAGPDYDSDPDLVIDNHNRLHLFLHKYPAGNPFNGANIRYGYSDNLGLTWTPAGFYQLSESGMRSHLVEGSRYDSKRNILWTFWKDERDFSSGQARADMVCSFSMNRGETWTSPEFVTDRDSFSIGFKAAALLNDGGVCVNYEVSESNGLSRVYFRRRSNPVVSIIGYDYVESEMEIKINQNIPNPFNPVTTIEYTVIKNQFVKIDVYDITGKLIKNIVNGRKSKGVYSVSWFGTDNNNHKVSSGIYIYKISADGEFIDSKRMLLLK